jgi:hypothetical protein
MVEIKPTRELLRIYGMQTGDGNVCGLMIASQMPRDLVLSVLKQTVDMMEKGIDQHLENIKVKDPADIRLHREM